MPDQEQFVSVDRREDGVAVIRLDRPKMNALSGELLRQLARAAAQLTADPPGAVVVWGGERIFAAGADISEFGGPAEARTVGGQFRATLDAVAAIPRATVPAGTPDARGGGWRPALARAFPGLAQTGHCRQPAV